MDKYIELEAAIHAVQRYGVGVLDADDFSPEQAERFIISKLSAIPAADVVEVRHGLNNNTEGGNLKDLIELSKALRAKSIVDEMVGVKNSLNEQAADAIDFLLKLLESKGVDYRENRER